MSNVRWRQLKMPVLIDMPHCPFHSCHHVPFLVMVPYPHRLHPSATPNVCALQDSSRQRLSWLYEHLRVTRLQFNRRRLKNRKMQSLVRVWKTRCPLVRDKLFCLWGQVWVRVHSSETSYFVCGTSVSSCLLVQDKLFCLWDKCEFVSTRPRQVILSVGQVGLRVHSSKGQENI